MSYYTVRLEAGNGQARILTCSAGSDEEAKAIAEARELELVAHDATRPGNSPSPGTTHRPPVPR